MGWATNYISKLERNENVSFRPRGGSMKGKIESGQLCTIEPAKEEDLKKMISCYVKSMEMSIFI